MLARLLAIPFLILLAIFFYLSLEVDEYYSRYMVALIIMLSVIYTMSPQINWWWYKRHPPKLDQEIRNLLIKHHSFYNILSVNEKQKFRDRMALYMIGVEFMSQGWEIMPEDIKGVIAANAVHLTFYQEDFLLSKFEQVVVYTTPFPSPVHPQTLHASEMFEEDGVLLFSAQQVMWAFLQPNQYYNLVLHEYIKAYQAIHPNKNYPLLKETDWQLLAEISGFQKAAIEGIIGLPDIDPSVVSGTLYFTHPEKYQAIAPDLFKKWAAIFVSPLKN